MQNTQSGVSGYFDSHIRVNMYRKKAAKITRLEKALVKYAARHGISIEFWEKQAKEHEQIREKIDHLSSDIITHVLFRACIAWQESPDNFYIIKVNRLDERRIVQSRLNGLTGKNYVYVMQKGLVCAARIANVWHRAVVERVYEDKRCRVRLLDYGRTEIVEWRQLVMLESDLLHVPPLAFKCALLNDPTNERKNGTLLAELFTGSSEFDVIVKDQQNGVHYVEILLDNSSKYSRIPSVSTSEARSLIDDYNSLVVLNAQESNMSNDELEIDTNLRNHINNINDGCVVAEIEEPSNLRNECNIAPSSSSRRFLVRMVNFINPGEFYICQNQKSLDILHHEVQKIGPNVDIIDDNVWSENDLCLVHDAEGDIDQLHHMWYRGRVQAIHATFVEVYLMDTGVTLSCDPSNLRKMQKDNMIMQVISIMKCSMAYLRPTSEKWDARNAQQIKSLIEGYDSEAISIQARGNLAEGHEVVLWGVMMSCTALTQNVATWTNLNQVLVDNGLAELSHEFEDVKDEFTVTPSDESAIDDVLASIIDKITVCDSDNEDENNNNNIPTIFRLTEPFLHVVNDAISIVEQWLPSVPILKTLFTGKPSHVDSKCRIYLFDQYREYLLTRMNRIINKTVQAYDATLSSSWTVGNPCFARFRSDKRFYRAEIRRVLDNKSSYVVRFVDYGNVEMVKLEHLRVANVCSAIPILTRRFRLPNIQPIADTRKWPKDVIEYIRFRLVDQLCMVRVQELSGDQSDAACEIRGNDVVDIRTDLLVRQLATTT